MFKARIKDGINTDEVELKDMQPGQIGLFCNQLVMRTLSTDHVQVMSLSQPTPNHNWTNPSRCNPVKLLPRGTIIEFEIL